MKYSQFEQVISEKRMERYLLATKKRKKKAILLYNANLNLSKEIYVIVSFFEVALRNAINNCLIAKLGDNWLRDSVKPSGLLDNKKSEHMRKVITNRYKTLIQEGEYSHNKLLSSLEFGIWKYMFADYQYHATGQVLLSIFPNKPKSSASKQYDNTYIFTKLNHINKLRNRIAHQEPLCFSHSTHKIDTNYIHTQYHRMLQLLNMMGIDSEKLLKGMDHVELACDNIENI